MPLPKPLTKEDILRAMRMTKSNLAASRYLNVCYKHYRMYARLYKDEKTGKTLLETHKNPGGKGVPKITLSQNKLVKALKGIVTGEVEASTYNPEKIKERLVVDGYLEEKCGECNFKKRRALDYKSPLILYFKDGNKNNYVLENLMFLCYNCYFLHVGKVFSEKDIKQLEQTASVSKKSKSSELNLDEYNVKKLRELGLIDDQEEDDLYSIVPNR